MMAYSRFYNGGDNGRGSQSKIDKRKDSSRTNARAETGGSP
jgi:hypothetical protein